MGKGDQDSRSRKASSKKGSRDDGIYSSKHIRQQESMMMCRPVITRSRSGEQAALAKAKKAASAEKQKR